MWLNWFAFRQFDVHRYSNVTLKRQTTHKGFGHLLNTVIYKKIGIEVFFLRKTK